MVYHCHLHMHDAVVSLVFGEFALEFIDGDMFVLGKVREHTFALLALGGFFIKNDFYFYPSFGSVFESFGDFFMGEAIDGDVDGGFG